MSHGAVVVTRAQLLDAGHGRGYGDRWVRAGSWERAAPSTYLRGAADLADRVRAAVAHAGPDAVLTGWAACALLRVPYVVDAGAVPVLVPAGRRRVSTARVRVLPTTRRPNWWTWHDEVRVAAPARAVVDAVRAAGDLRTTRAVVLSAIGRGVVDLPGLREELEAGARAGSAACRRALADAAAGAASAPEAELADQASAAARAGRLPQFLLNPDVRVDGRFVGRPDGWLVGLGMGWEVDSHEHHGGREDFEATLLRHDAFVAHGLSLLHLTPRRIRQLGPSAWTC